MTLGQAIAWTKSVTDGQMDRRTKRVMTIPLRPIVNPLDCRIVICACYEFDCGPWIHIVPCILCEWSIIHHCTTIWHECIVLVSQLNYCLNIIFFLLFDYCNYYLISIDNALVNIVLYYASNVSMFFLSYVNADVSIYLLFYLKSLVP